MRTVRAQADSAVAQAAEIVVAAAVRAAATRVADATKASSSDYEGRACLRHVRLFFLLGSSVLGKPLGVSPRCSPNNRRLF